MKKFSDIQNNSENIDKIIDEINSNKTVISNTEDRIELTSETENDGFSEEINRENIESEFEWYIEIPKIKLYAPIEEGTDEDVLNRSIGHFETTSRRNGNCRICCS